MDKIDARKLKPEGREQLKRMVIRLRKQSGMTCAELAGIAGVHLRTVETWIKRAHREGESSLKEKRRGRTVGTKRKLTTVQEIWIQQQVVGFRPEQKKLPFALWSRRAIKELVKQEFGVELQDRLVGKYLKRWGYTPQRPIKRALEQNPEQIEAWLKDSYPEIARRARQEGAEIYWGDETAVKEDANWVRGYAPAGQTPVLSTPARWIKLSMISAITNKGATCFEIVEGTINSDRFIDFLGRLIREAGTKVFLIVDNLRVHHAKVVTEWLKEHLSEIEVFYLPPYAPESNPDEYLNNDFKFNLRQTPPSEDKKTLLEKAIHFMKRLQETPSHVAAYFRHPKVAYAA